ncbi:MAG: hypothetical protein ACLR78_10465 [Roseburia sp.]
MITALALMIAVAGYFSYMNNNMDDGKLQTAAEAANAEVSAGNWKRITTFRMKMFCRMRFLRRRNRTGRRQRQ